MAAVRSPGVSGRLAYLRAECGDAGLVTELTVGTERMRFAARRFDPVERPIFDILRVPPEIVEQAGSAFVANVLDPELRRVLEQWSKGQAEDPVLIVSAADDVCAGLPWELLPAGLRVPTVFVVRAPELDLDLEDPGSEWLAASGVRLR